MKKVTPLTDTLNHYDWIRKDRLRITKAAKSAQTIWLAKYNNPSIGIGSPVGRWGWL